MRKPSRWRVAKVYGLAGRALLKLARRLLGRSIFLCKWCGNDSGMGPSSLGGPSCWPCYDRFERKVTR
jgi:hypothetical protein